MFGTASASLLPRIDAEVQKEIDALREASERASNPQSIQRAAVAECWVDDVVAKLDGVHAAIGASAFQNSWPRKAPSRTGLPSLAVDGGAHQLIELLQNLKQPRIQDNPSSLQDPILTVTDPDTGSHLDVPEFEFISDEDFEAEATEYKRQLDALSDADVKPPPPLNPEQRAFARADLEAQQIIARGRAANEPADVTLARLEDAGLKQLALLQGAGGCGKSVLLAAQRRVIARQNLGTMAISAWTGVAAAPFTTPTLCSLLGIDFTRLNGNMDFSEKRLAALRAEFALLFGDPQHLIEFVVDEVSFLDPAVLHWIDIMLQRLTDRPGLPFGGVLVRLFGDFWQKPPPGGVSMAEELVRLDSPVNGKAVVLDPTCNRAKGLAHFRTARRTTLNRQMRAAEDLAFQDTLQARNKFLGHTFFCLPPAWLCGPQHPNKCQTIVNETIVNKMSSGILLLLLL